MRSGLRDVPDHQEVFVDVDSDESLVVEVLEHQADVADRDAPAFFFRDLAEANDASAASLDEAQLVPHADAPGLPAGTPVLFAAGRQQVAKFREAAANEVGVLLVVVRLAAVASELLVTLNYPRVLDSASSSARAVASGAGGGTGPGAGPGPDAGAGVAAPPLELAARAVVRRALRSLAVHDWGLFGAA
jgi:hypothetical protein